jgi:Tfp pilus assembly protein PilX
MTRPANQNGFILLTVLVTTVFIMLIGIASLDLVTANLRTARQERYLVNAQFSADAGIDDAVRQLNADDSWAGNGMEQTLFTNSEFKTTFQTTVTAGSTNLQKFINVVAKTYAPSTSTTPKYIRKYSVEMRGITAGNYSVVTGVGGLVMTNSSKIVGGSVYVNGTITMSNTAQIGLSTKPVAVRAAHQSCPVPATAAYPRVCGTGENGQPISITSPNAVIYGDVQATNQTDGSKMFSPGLVSGSPGVASLPDHDRAGQISAVASTLSGNFSCSSGSYSWPANYHITGNVSIGNSCEVTVNGDVWIGGTLSMSNSKSKMIVANSLGTTQPVIMVDGTAGATFSQSTTLQSNTSNTGFIIITYWSTAPCSPNCSNVTGTDLYNSRDDTTISLSNSASGPNTEFYARWSQISVGNSGNIGALVGQTVLLNNSGAVTFGTTVSGLGAVDAWVVKSYKRTF